ncbi:MAG: NAD(P)/FAD-dependent oxidoreductase, partial [Micromonosporaceae bacterium]
MANPDYDVIIVGARCAGSPTAMLLARQGYRVLVLDRATFPSDTISTHVVHPPAVTALRRWGLLDQLTASGCPPVHTYLFDFGPIRISGSPGGEGGVAYCPRRYALDPILVQAASEADAEVREGATVDGVVISDGRVTGVRGHRRGGAQFAESAAIVIGADGLRSAVAEAVGADHYHGKPRLLVGYYSYWSGLPMHGRFETYVRPHRGFAACNTNDGLTVVIAGWPYSEFEANRRDIEGSVRRTMQLAPSFYERL